MLAATCAYRVRMMLGLATWLLVACGGRTTSDSLDSAAVGASAATGGTTSAAGGDQPIPATGGVVWAISGGAWNVTTGGSPWSAAGGAWGTGGASWVMATGGKPFTATGGASNLQTGGKSASSTGGSSSLSCAQVTCPSIPSTCKQIIQAPDACCPTCLDTGCPPCEAVTCPSGTHSETPVGACCPECVTNPPDACTKGKQDYASLRAAMVDKYGSSGCKNSSDCVIVAENNLCAQTCGVPLPGTMSASFQMNLDSNAKTNCATCPTGDLVVCAQVPACVNGKCVAVNSP